jgi:predicted Zn finger-like uncharacterized protein
MAFAVNCKSCQARFLLNDDLLRRKVAGKVVTVRCRQCHATIEVDASDVDPLLLPDSERPPQPALGATRAPRPAPAPPRPAAKSTLMGIGAPRAAAATELVALSPGLLAVKTADAEPATAQGFPEPPPPPEAVEVLDAGDWDELETPALAQVETKDEPVPESLDDFAEELPPSLPPEEEMPSSTGTPSLRSLTHHDEHAPKARSDDFLVNMTAAMNGGIAIGAPTIDVSGLSGVRAAEHVAPSIDVANLVTPARGARTLPQFLPDDGTEPTVRITPPSAPADHAASASPETWVGPSMLEQRPLSNGDKPADSPRARRNVVAPATKSLPPAAEKKTSGLAAPLLLALAAAAGFLIWKRSATHPAPEARAEPTVERAPATPPPAPVATEVAAAPAASEEPAEELTFESAPSKPAPRVGERPSSAAVAAAAPAEQSKATGVQDSASKEEPKAESPPEVQPPAEPAGPFDRAAASAALNASAAQASSCRKDGDPSGVASVVITFAPSGRVTSANISGPPFAGTPTGGCIAATLRKAKVPPFAGERVTVSKTVVIQ